MGDRWQWLKSDWLVCRYVKNRGVDNYYYFALGQCHFGQLNMMKAVLEMFIESWMNDWAGCGFDSSLSCPWQNQWAGGMFNSCHCKFITPAVYYLQKCCHLANGFLVLFVLCYFNSTPWLLLCVFWSHDSHQLDPICSGLDNNSFFHQIHQTVQKISYQIILYFVLSTKKK